MSTDQLITLIVALGGGAFLRELLGGLWKWLSGRQARERDAFHRLAAELDNEADYRRRVAEHAHMLRAILLRAGYPPASLPPFPGRALGAGTEEPLSQPTPSSIIQPPIRPKE